MVVERLDWGDASSWPECVTHQGAIDIVLGSELVYTTSTATSCANLVRCLLREHPHLLILLVQVIDRDGWKDVFLPLVTSLRGVQVDEGAILDPSIHETASHLVPHGGSLEPSDFGACFIYMRPGD
jgi:hypothetical protein